jgi:hypothetical protein
MIREDVLRVRTGRRTGEAKGNETTVCERRHLTDEAGRAMSKLGGKIEVAEKEKYQATGVWLDRKNIGTRQNLEATEPFRAVSLSSLPCFSFSCSVTPPVVRLS